MSDGKSGGSKTFFLILITVVLAIGLGIFAMLILSPGLELFGIKYLVKNETAYFRYFDGNPSDKLDFSEYSEINLDVENCKVEINKGASNTMSSVTFQMASNGFYKAGTEIIDYDYSLTRVGTTLSIKMIDPNYSFWKLSDVSKVIINIGDSMPTELTFNITTKNGNVTVGGKCDTAGTAEEIRIDDFSVNTNGGSVLLSKYAYVSNSLDITTENGNVMITNDITAQYVNIESKSGKITANSFTNTSGEISITGETGGIQVGDIAGNVDFTMKNGYFYAGNIEKNFSAPNDKLETTIIRIDRVGGTFEAVNRNGAFKVEIKECAGEVDIVGANHGITLGNVQNAVTLNTTKGDIKLTINSTNTSELNVETESGSIEATLNAVKGSNNFKTKSGSIYLNCKSANPFWAHLKTSNTVRYLEETAKNVDMTGANAYEVGENALSTDLVYATSENGLITLKLIG